MNRDIKVRKVAKPRFYKDLMVIGWREWVCLPELNIRYVKAKIDTGARTSALHAYDVKEYKSGRKTMVQFKVHPVQKNQNLSVKCVGELVEKRKIKDSGGTVTLRPVIRTPITIGDLTWEIELTLINRDEMGFRMLLGRAAIKGHLLVNPGRSHLLGYRVKKDSV